MRPLGVQPFAPPPAARQPPTVQQRPQGPRLGADQARKQGQTDPLLRQRDLFERAPTIKLPAAQSQPQGRQPSRKPEATMLIQARDLAPGAASAKPAAPAAAPKAGPAPAPAAPKAPGALDGLRRGGAEVMGKLAGSAARALDGLELSAQLGRISKPSALRTAMAKTLGAAGDAMRGAAARFGRYAQGVQTAQRFADGGGTLSLPKAGADAAGRADGAADWRRAGAAFSTSTDMVKSLSQADDERARQSAKALVGLLHDHAQANPANAGDAHRAMRAVADAASALGAAREPADAAQAARSLRTAGKQVRQLFVERGGGAASVSTDQAAQLQRLATVVRGGDEAADAFKRGSHRSLAAIGAELASALAQGGDGQAAQALALRDRTHELLSAQASGSEPAAVGAAKRLHVAIRQAQSGAQWERERLLQTLDRSGARAA